ncbi:MAG: DUF1499 domain-containing protein [Thermodesulfovibrionales bacterium]
MHTELDKKWPFPALFCLCLAVVLSVASVMSGLGTRLEWWGFRAGLDLLRWIVYGQVAMAVISLSCLFLPAARRSDRSLVLLLAALVISLVTVSVPVRMFIVARSVPMIHDITTDTDNPPQFNAILKLRKNALNPVAYSGQEVADKQHKAYPDIVPLVFDLAPDQAFELSLKAAKKLGWTIISANKDTGLIEATDTTFWFGFTDDIVIRISPQDRGSRIDLRSLSRVGKSDVGANAKRIREFLKRMKKR